MKIRFCLKRFLRKSYYIIMSFLSMFLFTFNVNANTVGPSGNILEFQWLNGQVQNASATQITRFNQIFYYHNSTSSSNYRGLFAFTNNNIYGNYFSFAMYVKGDDMYIDGVNARIQFSDGSWWSCPINTSALTDHQYLFNASCEINNGMNLSVYKYGFNFNPSINSTYQYLNIAISQLNYFSNVNDFSNAISQQNQIIQNGITQENNNHRESMDYNENNIPQPDSSNSDDFQSGVDDIMNNFDNINYNDISIPKDNSSNNWVWSTMFALFGTHGLITATFIGVLSIGVLKQVLGR